MLAYVPAPTKKSTNPKKMRASLVFRVHGLRMWKTPPQPPHAEIPPSFKGFTTSSLFGLRIDKGDRRASQCRRCRKEPPMRLRPGAPTTRSSETYTSKPPSRKAAFAAISRVWLSPISGLCAKTSSSGPFWRVRLWRQKSRTKLDVARKCGKGRGGRYVGRKRVVCGPAQSHSATTL